MDISFEPFKLYLIVFNDEIFYLFFFILLCGINIDDDENRIKLFIWKWTFLWITTDTLPLYDQVPPVSDKDIEITIKDNFGEKPSNDGSTSESSQGNVWMADKPTHFVDNDLWLVE